MFKTFNKDFTSNNIYIQGSFSKDSNADIAGILFQNYDNDTSTVYNMCKIAMRDSFGSTTSNGVGDMAFYSSSGNNALSEVMRITHNKRIGILTPSPNFTLDVNGTVNAIGYNNLPLASFLKNGMVYTYSDSNQLSNLSSNEKQSYVPNALYIETIERNIQSSSIQRQHVNFAFFVSSNINLTPQTLVPFSIANSNYIHTQITNSSFKVPSSGYYNIGFNIKVTNNNTNVNSSSVTTPYSLNVVVYNSNDNIDSISTSTDKKIRASAISPIVSSALGTNQYSIETVFNLSTLEYLTSNEYVGVYVTGSPGIKTGPETNHSVHKFYGYKVCN